MTEVRSVLAGDREERTFALTGVEVRDEGGAPMITGYAAVFNSLSQDLGGFRETIRPGAFKNALAKSDVRGLWNHNPDCVLGRNKSGTLRMEEDAKGLRVEIDPPDTSWGRDAMVSIKRGDVNQMSFAFRVQPKGETWDTQKGIRELIEIDELFDVSPVTYPAYRQTKVAVRTSLVAAGIDYDSLSAILLRSRQSDPLTAGDMDVVKSSIQALQEVEARGVGQAPNTPSGGTDEQALVRLRLLQESLRLKALV